MLRKLLKYDFKALFKFWWIAALINLALSIFGGLFTLIQSCNYWIAELLSNFTGGAIFLVNCSYVALIIVSFVLIFIRFYQNFFSDEGYLTFTLPVKRSQLLNSKVISGVAIVLASLVVCGVNVFIMELISTPAYQHNGGNIIYEYIGDRIHNLGPVIWVYALETLVLTLAVVVLAVVMLYFCITFGSMIVKKGKLIISIILCYGLSNLLVGVSFFSTFFCFVGAMLLSPLEYAITTNPNPIAVLALLGLIFYVGALSALFYSLQYGMLDKKLNLS